MASRVFAVVRPSRNVTFCAVVQWIGAVYQRNLSLFINDLGSSSLIT